MERKERDLDGYYYRCKRDGKWTNRCFTDLTRFEQMEFVKGFTFEQFATMIVGLHDVLMGMLETVARDTGVARYYLFALSDMINTIADATGVTAVRKDVDNEN